MREAGGDGSVESERVRGSGGGGGRKGEEPGEVGDGEVERGDGFRGGVRGCGVWEAAGVGAERVCKCD